mmetsp:Transcript_19412/g.9013  ORF Transcript_19412/g.9013 Transcript_19412/m.9013 type:complete len:107 (+) Transcript_19412:73-393(+)
MTLGINLVKNDSETKMSMFMVVGLSFTTPLGIGIGMAVSDSSDLIVGIFMSLTVGTFLYIATAEIIVEEFSLGGWRWWKFLAFMVGIAIVAGVMIYHSMTHDDVEE